jgi:hypothetical protein
MHPILFSAAVGPWSKYFYSPPTATVRETQKTAGLICSRAAPSRSPEKKACPTVDKIVVALDLSIFVYLITGVGALRQFSSNGLAIVREKAAVTSAARKA